MWAFIGENDRGSVKKPEDRKERGVSWLWMAIDKDTKLVLTTHVGTRQARDATIFMRKLKKRLLHDEQGNLAVKTTLAVDGHKAYVDAIDLAFGQEINAGRLVKLYTKVDPKTGEVLPGARYKGAIKERISGDPDFADVDTWRIERENGFMRQANRRFTRKTNGFSKDRLFHERSIAILRTYRNYCWQPSPMRPRDGSKQWQKRESAAMAAGLTEHIWSIDELIAASDEFKAAGRLASNDNSDAATVEVLDGSLPFWVAHSAYQRRAKIHAADCSACNNGLGKKGGTAGRGVWTGFATLKEAVAFAASAEPDHHSECRLCIGDYNTLTTFGRRR